MSLNFEGQIWKIVAEGNFLAIEIRNAPERQASFAVFDVSVNKLIAQNIVLNEPWWIGLQAISENYLVIHYYDQIQYANHKGFSVVNLKTKNVAWFNKKLIFEGINKDCLIAIDPKNQEQRYFTLSSGDEYLTIPFTKNDYEKTAHYPEIFEPNTSNYIKVESFITRKLNCSIKHLVEYLELEKLIIISYYVETEMLEKALIVLTKSGEILLNEITELAMKGVSDTTFFVMSNKLIYVRNLNILEILAFD